jgi:membrane protein DedA with SNARE-associated domain
MFAGKVPLSLAISPGPTLPILTISNLTVLALLLQASQPHTPRPGSIGSSPFLRWLISFGAIGIFVIAVIDSSIIPLPIPGTTDLLLLLISVHPKATAIHIGSLVALAIAGSLIGGYLTWNTGRKGGVPALEKHVSAKVRGRIDNWVKRHGSLAVFLAAVLPPPIPLTPFLLAAGALGVSRARFLISYSAARITRYSLIGWLGFHYGRQVVHFWRHSLAEWSTPILYIYGGLVVLGVSYALFKFIKTRRTSATKTRPQTA